MADLSRDPGAVTEGLGPELRSGRSLQWLVGRSDGPPAARPDSAAQLEDSPLERAVESRPFPTIPASARWTARGPVRATTRWSLSERQYFGSAPLVTLSTASTGYGSLRLGLALRRSWTRATRIMGTRRLRPTGAPTACTT